MTRFSETALRLSGLAARALGWTPPVFWAATPAELAACIGQETAEAAPPDRMTIAAMIERDRHG